MIIKRCPLIFNNVLTAQARCKINGWHPLARDLRNAVVQNGLYSTGPVFYQTSNIDGETKEADYRFSIPISASLTLKETTKYDFEKEFRIMDGLAVRHADLAVDLNVSYQLLNSFAEENGLKLQEPFYHIYLDVYGEGIIDIYAPIAKDGNGR